MSGAFTLTVPTHGLSLRAPYFVAVFVVGLDQMPLHLPAVVDDFGSLVIVGGPL